MLPGQGAVTYRGAQVREGGSSPILIRMEHARPCRKGGGLDPQRKQPLWPAPPQYGAATGWNRAVTSPLRSAPSGCSVITGAPGLRSNPSRSTQMTFGPDDIRRRRQFEEIPPVGVIHHAAVFRVVDAEALVGR